MRVPLARPDIGAFEKPLLDAAFDNRDFSSGKHVKVFESALASFLGVKHVVAANSGSSALLLAWDALKQLQLIDSAVKLPVLNYISDLAVLRQLRIRYDLVDFGEESNYPVHVMGAKYPNISSKVLVEDCCEALGTKGVGQLGLVSTHSFYTSHMITTGGEGGACATNNDEVADVLRSLREFGRIYKNGAKAGSPYDFQRLGYSMKMTDLQAAIGVGQVASLPTFLGRNHMIARRLCEATTYHHRLPLMPYDPDVAYFGFPIISKTPEKDVRYLDKLGIETRPLLCYLPSQVTCKTSVNYPVAKKMFNHIYWVSCHHGLTDEEVDYLVKCIEELP